MQNQNIFLRTWAALLLMLALVATASAQRGRDEGDYRILHARYGTAERNVDVTQRLRELAQEDRAFRMGNDTFGVDPDRGHVKVLRIYARGRDGQTRTFEFIEGSYVDGAQFTGWRGGNWGQGAWAGDWDGQRQGDAPYGGQQGYGSAPVYGVIAPYGGNRPGDDGDYRILQARYGTPERNVDVTEQLKALAVEDRQFLLTNRVLGVDPDPGRVKTLRIYARGRGGERMFEYREGSVVDGSQFTAWRGAEWGYSGWQGGWHGNDRADDRRGNDRADDRRGGNDYAGLTVVEATYGAGNRRYDVSERLRSLMRNGRIDIRVGNEALGGDPAPGARKSLWVTYAVSGNRRQQQVQADEGERLSLP